VDAESEQGTEVRCDECGAKLVVVGLDPIELDVSDESDEVASGDDFDDYEYDDSRY